MNFDEDNERNVNNYIEANKQRIEPYRTADLSRLDEESYLLRPTKTIEVKQMSSSPLHTSVSTRDRLVDRYHKKMMVNCNLENER